MTYYLGLDLGQKVDPSAAVLVEKSRQQLVVRYVERMPLGMPYPKVVERVRGIVQSPPVVRNCALAVDASGVGAPVVDMLRSARLGCGIMAYTITGGDRSGGESVTKRDLLSEVHLLMESGQLTIGKVTELGRLMKELTDVKGTVGPRGRTRMGADGYGEHDDLVIALALACWRAKDRGFCGEVGQRLL